MPPDRTSTPTRCGAWDVTLANGDTLQLRGHRMIVAEGGTLMVLDRDRVPQRMLSPHAWLECRPARSRSEATR